MIVPIFKRSGTSRIVGTIHRGIKLISNTMTIWERMIDRTLRDETGIGEEQFGVMPGTGATHAIFAANRRRSTGICKRNGTRCSLIYRRHMIGFHGRKFGGVRGSMVFQKSECVS